MSDLTDLTIAEAREHLAQKKISAVELAKAYQSRMVGHKDFNAYIIETPEIALAAAKVSDEKIAKGKAGIMEGIPIAVKDLFCTRGVLSTACSGILAGFKPPYESTVTANIFGAGAVMLGKTNMDEFAMGSANLNSFYGAVKNPWKRKKDNKDLVPGGSSGGSAAAVAARICAGALGSDTGGSIRQPASFTGTVGIKPTYGRCSRWGMIAFASSLDQAGSIARTVQDAAIMLEAISGFDEKDSTSAEMQTPKFEKALAVKDVKGLKIGIPKEYHSERLDPEIKKLWESGADWLKKQGAEIVDISLPHSKYALPVYYIIAPAEASSNLARYDGVRYGLRIVESADSLDEMYMKTRGEGFGPEVKRRIMMGTYVLSAGYYDAYYRQAQKVRKLIIRDFDEAFKKVDVILTPTTPSAAFALDEKPTDPVEMYLNDIFTVPVNLAGIPAISVPAGLSKDGLPLGLQLIGKMWDEETLFRVGGVLETAADFKTRAL